MLDWIFEGIVGWVAGIISQMLDAVSGLFLPYYTMLEDMLLHGDLYEFTGDGGLVVKVEDKDFA